MKWVISSFRSFCDCLVIRFFWRIWSLCSCSSSVKSMFLLSHWSKICYKLEIWHLYPSISYSRASEIFCYSSISFYICFTCSSFVLLDFLESVISSFLPSSLAHNSVIIFYFSFVFHYSFLISSRRDSFSYYNPSICFSKWTILLLRISYYYSIVILSISNSSNYSSLVLFCYNNSLFF